MPKVSSEQISKNELKKFVKNIDLILRGKLKHVDERNISTQDIYRLAELISTASERAKIKSKVYYGKSKNPLISNLVAIVADNPDIGRVITAMRMRPKQIKEIF